LKVLEAKNDSLMLNNSYLKYNNMLLSDKYEETRKMIDDLRGKSSSLEEAEALLREKNKELRKELRIKSYLKLQHSEGSGFRVRNTRPIKTTKASIIEKVRGCVTIMADPSSKDLEKILYFQFLDPNMKVIEDNANMISVNGNTYSKRVELICTGEEFSVCDFITIPQGSLEPGRYTLNVFEDEKLLSSAEFILK
ncbi:MAG: hypothetical protein WBN11_10190, partial [Eudoraea sp.]